jgi:transcription antitermination factor NusG
VKDDPVVIADGPFKDLEGKVGDIDEDRGKVKVLVVDVWPRDPG